MSSFLYFCPNCNRLYKANEIGKKLKCSQCSKLALDMNISDDEYNALDLDQRQELKNRLKKKNAGTSDRKFINNTEKKKEELTKIIPKTNKSSFFVDEMDVTQESLVESKDVPKENSSSNDYTMYYCKECDKVYKSDQFNPNCEFCKQKLVSLHYGEKAWAEKTEEQRKALINEARGTYVPQPGDPDPKIAGYSSVGSSLKSLSKVGLVLSLIGCVIIIIILAESGEGQGVVFGIALALVSSIMYLAAMGIGELCILLTSVNAKLDSIEKALKK